MGERDDEPTDERVDPAPEDSDDASAETKIYECADCEYRLTAEHHPGECPNCGGEMIDISVSRE